MTKEGRGLVSCVRYLRERYGVTLVVEVARGSKSEKVLRQGFDKLPCYGSLKGVKESTLRDVARALVLQGYLEQTQGEYPLLKLGPQAESLLNGQARVEMRVRQSQEEPEKKPAGSCPRATPSCSTGCGRCGRGFPGSRTCPCTSSSPTPPWRPWRPTSP